MLRRVALVRTDISEELIASYLKSYIVCRVVCDYGYFTALGLGNSENVTTYLHVVPKMKMPVSAAPLIRTKSCGGCQLSTYECERSGKNARKTMRCRRSRIT
jgi:hypothetical protein